jgi:hypothetical protein
MRHGQLHDRLIAAAGAFVAIFAAVLLAMPSAARADDAQVTVVSPGGVAQTLSLAALAGSEDVVGQAYEVRSSAGASTTTVTGFSLAKLIEAAGADPYGFSYLEVQRPAGGSVLLSREQALGPGALTAGPPVIYATATGTAFLRPSASSEDANAEDCFEAPQGVTLVLRKGAPLQIEIEASVLRTRPGKPVSFTAIVERAGAGEQLTYSWYFDDGHSAPGPSVRHSFARRGSYDVVVGVTTPGDKAGTSAVVNIQVGEPLSGGPDRRGGGSNRDADAPDHGVATGTGDAVPPGPESASPAPAETAPAPPPPARGAERKPEPPKPPAGEQVSGVLLSAKTKTPDQPDKPPAARTGQLSEDSGGLGLSGGALGVLATLGLLGAGVLIETRGLIR